ncbi:MAG: cytochrome c [Bacteroidia bacterium]|nr:cytochrome c [Bacteroidia bacterium]
MKTWHTLLLIILFPSILSCEEKAATYPEQSTIDQKAFVEWVQHQDSVLDLQEVLKTIPPEFLEEVELTDKAFKKKLRYQAISLEFLFGMWQDSGKLDISNTSLIFPCKDGYSPSMPLANMYGKGGFITLGIKTPSGSYAWPDSVAEKFAPLYLVWKDLDPGVYGYPWPYGLTNIKLKNTQNTFAAALPEAHAGFDKGYKSFKLYCMKCHQINKVGGEMGPELNYPKSITDYMDKEDIWGFIKNPQSYRYNSKMPAIKPLSRDEFEEIYKYLSHMKSRTKAS